MANIETVHKHFFKVFYKWTKMKKFKLQILKHNICYINILVM